MKQLFLSALFLFIFCAFASAQTDAKTAAAQTARQFSLQPAAPDVLQESDDIKQLVLKYDAASAAKKPAVKIEIEKRQTEEEENNIQAQEQRIQRQEDKIKELRAMLESRKKNKAKTVKEKVDRLISKDSVEKIKAESSSQKIKDKIKSKTK